MFVTFLVSNVHFDDGDVHVPGDALNQYMFKHKPQSSKDPSPKLSRAPKSSTNDKVKFLMVLLLSALAISLSWNQQ